VSTATDQRPPAPANTRSLGSGRPSGSGAANRRMRWLDDSVGPGVLRALGAVRRRRVRPANPRRIGVMKTVGIGDMVLASSVVCDLQAAFPAAEVVVLCGPDNVGLARVIPGVQAVALQTARPWAVIPVLRRLSLDMLIDLGQWTRLEAIYAALSGARWTAGFDTPGYARGPAYDATVVHSAQCSELENYRALVRAAGIAAGAEPSFAGRGTATPPVDGRFVVFHPWPGGFRSELREWSEERWRELAARLAERDVAVVVTGGPGDMARSEAFAASCESLATPVVSVAGRYDLDALIDVLRAATCVVSVNTGLMHLAAATGVPTLGLNGPTASTRWGATGPQAVNVDSDLPGCGFLNLGFEYAGEREDCMDGISVQRVAELLLERLDG
jgi:heptosyltransferase-3